MMIVPTLCVGTPSEDAPRPALDLRQRFVDVLELALIDAERRGLRSHAESGNDQETFKHSDPRIPSGGRVEVLWRGAFGISRPLHLLRNEAIAAYLSRFEPDLGRELAVVMEAVTADARSLERE
jgi:hypothetical protein